MNDLSVNTKELDKETDLQGQYLTFVVGKDSLGVAIDDVKEIIEIRTITSVPMTPNYIKGVINLRGNVVPVIDLSARLGAGVSEMSKRSCIVLVEVVAEDSSQHLGMLVDQVQEILEIAPDNLQSAPSFGSDIRVDFIQAMGRVGDDFIILLDINRVLSINELAALAEITNSVPAPAQIAE